VLGYVTFYYGILTTYNVAAIYILTKAGSKDQINSINESNSKLFGLSEQTLRYLTALTIGTYKIRQLLLTLTLIIIHYIIGIFAVWYPAFFVISSKDYYYIDENGNKNSIDISYKYFYIILSLIVFSLTPFPVLSTAETTKEFKDFYISKQKTDVIRFSSYISEYGYIGLFKMIFSDANDFKLGFFVAANECLLRYLLIYAVDLNISVSIDWTYVLLSIGLRSLGISIIIALLFKYKLTFIFDSSSEPLMLLLVFVATVAVHTSTIIIEYAFLVSTNEIGSISSSSFTINSTGLTVMTLIVERSASFVIYNLYSIPSVLSWTGFKEAETRGQEYRKKFVGETVKTKV
jgi:hypothetical protein